MFLRAVEPRLFLRAGRDGLGKDFLNLLMRTGYNVDADQFANPSSRSCPSVSGSLDSTDITSDQHCDKTSTDVFLADENHVGRFDHRVRSLHCSDKTSSFYHAQGF